MCGGDLAELLRRIDAKRAELNSKRPLTAGELARLYEDFAVEYTYNSTAIEGNTLTLRETDLVLRGLTIDKKPLKDHLEAVGHKEAFDYVRELVQTQEPVSEYVIKQIHSLVLADKREDRGVYRQIPVRILGASVEPAQPYDIPLRMETLLAEYAASREHIIVKLARFHCDFEAIHPFIDGNGRTGRLLINWELMKAGFPPINIKYADRRAYYDTFEMRNSGDGAMAMAALLARYADEELGRYLNLLA